MEYEYSRRVYRHPIVADIEVTDVQSGMQTRVQTKDLTLFGCSVVTMNLFPKGTSVKVKVIHKGQELAAIGKVVYARPDIGMGIAFTNVDPKHERIIEGWIAELESISVQRQ